jgi:hypothetical protein
MFVSHGDSVVRAGREIADCIDDNVSSLGGFEGFPKFLNRKMLCAIRIHHILSPRTHSHFAR